MAVTTATLGGVTLPDVADDGFDEAYGYRGADRRCWMGRCTALVTTTAKRRFELRWRGDGEPDCYAPVGICDGARWQRYVCHAAVAATVTRDVGFFESGHQGEVAAAGDHGDERDAEAARGVDDICCRYL